MFRIEWHTMGAFAEPFRVKLSQRNVVGDKCVVWELESLRNNKKIFQAMPRKNRILIPIWDSFQNWWWAPILFIWEFPPQGKIKYIMFIIFLLQFPIFIKIWFQPLLVGRCIGRMGRELYPRLTVSGSSPGQVHWMRNLGPLHSTLMVPISNHAPVVHLRLDNAIQQINRHKSPSSGWVLTNNTTLSPGEVFIQWIGLSTFQTNSRQGE